MFPVCQVQKDGKTELAAFRIDEHHRRLRESCEMMGIDTWAMADDFAGFTDLYDFSSPTAKARRGEADLTATV